MPKQVIDDNVWSERIDSANRYYIQWENLFKCKILEKYYEGLQWKSQKELGYNPYVINKVYETIQIKIAQFVPSNLKYQVSPKMQDVDDLEAAINSAQLKEDVLNYCISDNKRHFSEEFEAAYKDHFFRFAIMEIGYAADWILNPNANKPLLKGNVDKRASNKHKVVSQPDELPKNERVYFKHIPAKRFRVGGIDHKYLSRCTWVGYYDYVLKNDLLSIKGLMNKDKIESITDIGAHSDDNVVDDKDTKTFVPGAIKYWNIWDLRAGVHILILDSNHTTIYQRKFKRIPLFDLRPDSRVVTEGFYPIPPAFHWLSCQDEINETREMLRAHRRRFVRKFQVLEGAVDDEELEKFETGPDGAAIKVKRENAITPIENADLGNSLQLAMESSADDLNKISGEANPDRGVTDRGTATEANITQQAGSVRQGKDQSRVVMWLSDIGRETLLTVRDNFALGFYVQSESPEGEDNGEVQVNNTAFKWVSTEDLSDGYDFKIDVDITSISVTAQQDEQKKLFLFLQTLTQFPMLAFSPILIREVAYRIGYRNTRAIRELQKMALLAELGRMQQLQGALGPQQPQQLGGQSPGPQNPQAQQMVAAATPPNLEQIRQQLGGQMQ